MQSYQNMDSNNSVKSLSQMTREEKIAKLQELQSAKAQTKMPLAEMSREQKIQALEQLKSSGAKPISPSDGSPPPSRDSSKLLPADTPSVDLYSNDEASFLESFASATRAMDQGLLAIPSKIGFDINTTIDGIAHSLGIIDKTTYDSNIKHYKQKLFNSIDYENPDVKRFPGITQNTQDIGSLGAETFGVGKLVGAAGKAISNVAPAIGQLFNATNASRVGNTVLTGANAAGQSALLGALQGDPGAKPETAAISAAIGGGIATGFAGAGNTISALLGRGKSMDNMANAINAQNQVETQSGVPLTLNQRLSNPNINPQFKDATNQIQDAMSPYIDDISKVEKGSSTATKGTVIDAFGKAQEAAKTESNKLYGQFIKEADNRINTVIPTKALSTADDVQTSLNSKTSPFAITGVPKEIENAVKTVRALGDKGAKPSTVYEVRQTIDSVLQGYYGAEKGPAERQAISALTKLRNSLDDDIAQIADVTDTAALHSNAKSYWQSNVLALRNAGIEAKDGISQVRPLMNFLKDPTKKSQAQATLNAMGQEGQQAVRINIATEIAEKALDDTGVLNPNKFVLNYKQALKEYGILYQPKDQQIINGLSLLLKSGKIPKALPDQVPSQILGTDTQTIKSVIGYLANSKTGQNIILTLGRLPGTSPKTTKTINSIRYLANNIRNAAAASAADQITQPEPSP
jgi:uncharacterized protein YjbJ (UPF0337 family)